MCVQQGLPEPPEGCVGGTDFQGVAWLGDSDAVLCQRRGNGQLVALKLTDAHHPDKDEELRRIEAAGGSVFRRILSDRL